MSDFVSIKEAAAILGRSIDTLRNWDRVGFLPAIREPLTGNRLFSRDAVASLAQRMGRSVETCRCPTCGKEHRP